MKQVSMIGCVTLLMIFGWTGRGFSKDNTERQAIADGMPIDKVYRVYSVL